MANEDKIRILDEQPVENAGSLLYIRTLAGSSDASKPTSQLANGSLFIETDTGKVFILDEDDGWTEMQAGNGGGGGSDKFIVTLTPTALDYSGTMDKTVAEINAAYEAGMEIVFQIHTEISGFNVILTSIADEMLGLDTDGSLYGYWGFQALFVIKQMDTMILVSTQAGDTGSENTYSTSLYPLTPAS